MGDMGQDRIRRLAGRLRLLVWAVIVGTAAVYLAARIGTQVGDTRLVTIGTSDPAVASPLWVQDVSIALVLLALWQLADMLRLVGRGDHFSPAAIRRFRGFALFLFIASAVMFLAPLVMAIASDHPGPEQLRLPVKLRELLTMLVTGALFLVARLLEEARQIDSDLKEIV